MKTMSQVVVEVVGAVRAAGCTEVILRCDEEGVLAYAGRTLRTFDQLYFADSVTLPVGVFLASELATAIARKASECTVTLEDELPAGGDYGPQEDGDAAAGVDA